MQGGYEIVATTTAKSEYHENHWYYRLPGAGKSTLVDALLGLSVKQEKKWLFFVLTPHRRLIEVLYWVTG
jgi:hypothetical protein